MIQEFAKQVAEKRLEVASAAGAVADLDYRLEEKQIEVLRGVSYAELGKNEGERKQKQEQLLRDNAEWQAIHLSLHEARLLLERRKAELESLRDLRRGEEWLVRAALAGLGVPTDSDDPAGDDAFDDVATERATLHVVSKMPPAPPNHSAEEIEMLWGQR